DPAHGVGRAASRRAGQVLPGCRGLHPVEVLRDGRRLERCSTQGEPVPHSSGGAVRGGARGRPHDLSDHHGGLVMATRKSTMIGPFSRGLNTYDDPTALHDQELVEALNFDPGLDGSMRNRPPFTNTGDSFPVSGSGVPHLLGFFYDVGDVAILIASDG